MERVVVVGGGIAGVTIALELAQRGRSVTVVEDPARPATTPVAAGMLAPAAETDFGEELLVTLERDARALWPELARFLAGETGVDVLFEATGTLVAAQTPGDLEHLGHLATLQQRLGLAARLLGRDELLALEPALASHLAGGVLLPDDAQVDNRRALTALWVAARRASVERRDARAVDVAPRSVELDDGSRLSAEAVVVATGSWLPELCALPIQPVKGVTIRGTLPAPLRPTHCLRGELRGRRVYVVSRRSGELVVGATAEEAPLDDRAPRARDLLDLLEDARALLPALGELAVSDVAVGFRPATPDGLPLAGALEDGLWVHGGHYRHGILLAPLTARYLAAAMCGEASDPRLTALAPARFVGAR